MKMLIKVVVATLALSTALAPSASAQGKKTPADSAVRSVVERYLHGLKFNDTIALRDAFWPETRLFFVGKDGQIAQLTQPKWYGMFAGNIGKEEKGDLRITSVDVTNDVASVKVVEDYPGSRYTDYLNLLRINGRWWIVNKIYTMERVR